MSYVLVVDDSEFAQRVVSDAVARIAPDVRVASNGRVALEMIRGEPPDLVVTDLVMPEMDGLQLVSHCRQEFPHIPIILITAQGSEDIAAQALREGAASYVPKRLLDPNLPTLVSRLLQIVAVRQNRNRLLRRVHSCQYLFELDNDYSYIATLVGFLQENILEIGLLDESNTMQFCVAFDEALNNAVFHGNLELSSDLREEADNRFLRLADQRRHESPYKERRVSILAKLTPAEARVVICDGGKGFDTTKLPDPTDPANLERISGRGLLLMRMFMDEVHFNSRGNEVTLVKRRWLRP